MCLEGGKVAVVVDSARDSGPNSASLRSDDVTPENNTSSDTSLSSHHEKLEAMDSTDSSFLTKFIRPAHHVQPRSRLLEKTTEKTGLRHTVYSASGNEYTGEWKDNVKHGKGTQVWKKTDAIYDGEWKCGRLNGHGTYSVLNPQTSKYTRKYCGEWRNGKKHGFGTFMYKSSSVYEGEWSEDSRCGWGRMCFANGDVYEGEWTKDQTHGNGILRYANGNWYEGVWKEGKKEGNGKSFNCERGTLYEGVWLDGTATRGTLSDFGRDQAPRPPKYPIPELQLKEKQVVSAEAQSVCKKTFVTQE
ncbi:hypothetical protein WMY93_004908 [Mugilogobius chulae]|uniref:MORN repeat-containing protein 3 n=1 Tax=Mugilogobius chulae TaxID=88201 RepID=A0AAW0PQ33_9GOBI